MINQNLLLGDDGYLIQRSLRFRSSASAYLNRTPASAGNRQIFTLSAWLKRGSLGVSDCALFGAQTDANNRLYFRFESNDTLNLYFAVSGTAYDSATSMVFRDPSAWYHIVIAIDTTQATASNRIKVYVNGIQQTLGTYSAPPQNTSTPWNNTVSQLIAKKDSGSNYFDGYLTDVYSIDGQALTPSSFGETDAQTGVWIPKKYSGTYGTNGFYLNFSDNSSNTATTIGKDSSGNGNNWTPNNISVTSGSTYDSMTDVPTLTSADAANYAVWNPLKATAGTYSNGNLTLIRTSTANVDLPVSTIQIAKTVPVYCELTFGSSDASYGIAVSTSNSGANGIVGSSSDGLSWGAYITADASYRGFWNNNSRTAFDFSGGTVYQLAFDQANGKLWFGKDGTWYNSGNPTSGTNATYSSISTTADFYITALCPSTGCSVNFGQRPFAYTPPTGFKALNTFNLPTPTIGATASTQANKYFDATLYTGNATARSIVNTGGFQPDFVWIKERSGVGWNIFTDSVRGVTKNIYSNSTNAEATNNGTDITSFNSDGFSLGTDSNGDGVNRNGNTVVAWQWKANGSGSSNTQGSITSTVSANTTAGFSIVTYTGNGTSGATIGHGLGVAPSMVIVKRRDTTGFWLVYHVNDNASPQSGYLRLQGTNAFTSDTNIWNNTAPTSTVFSVGTSADINASSGTYVAYCFAEVAGYSKFGSYTGNGSSTAGPFVFCGFRPRFVMVKRTDSTGNWSITDTSINPYNNTTGALRPNTSDSESTIGTVYVQPVSNGFYISNNNTDTNASSGTYIYMAFCESPFKYSLAR